MTRHYVLDSLLNLSTSIEELRSQLATFPWDSEELVQLKWTHVDARLRDFLSKKISREVIVSWANCIESRDDIGMDRTHAEQLISVIHELANPELYSELTFERASALLSCE